MDSEGKESRGQVVLGFINVQQDKDDNQDQHTTKGTVHAPTSTRGIMNLCVAYISDRYQYVIGYDAGVGRRKNTPMRLASHTSFLCEDQRCVALWMEWHGTLTRQGDKRTCLGSFTKGAKQVWRCGKYTVPSIHSI